MPSPTLLVARRILLALAFAAPFAAVQAQPAPAGASAPPAPLQNQEQQAEGRRNQKVEHIHTEDSGASVDEVRYGGRTQSINVKPKANVPGYEVRPNDPGARTGSGEANSNGNGARVWNVMKF
ncbi:starvation-inducible outer membrane lipoprotein [Variovorax paradoxus]|jgi:hypothetical protein|uniref:hypothetical protein n=1 Tax=Variovorax TaxID=34072 RepID=UPI0007017F74|nr:MULTISPECIES: hypothetical protein [Variovorax]KQU88370.1 hypothetical protein ASC78_24480 [Variovorax sp. Root318D1]MDP9932226.1 starvation-inducible outer membrane lipoprotein [Variovorax paradoxus]MDQ0023624.1 starvation-inducible outer membrane lipoprotein [Variovorax paradoxus]